MIWDKLKNITTNSSQTANFKDILVSTTTAEQKIKLELIGLLMQPDRLRLDAKTALVMILKKLLHCEAKYKKETKFFNSLIRKLSAPV